MNVYLKYYIRDYDNRIPEDYYNQIVESIKAHNYGEFRELRYSHREFEGFIGAIDKDTYMAIQYFPEVIYVFRDNECIGNVDLDEKTFSHITYVLKTNEEDKSLQDMIFVNSNRNIYVENNDLVFKFMIDSDE
jgi:hypothetical protein